jgi:deoxyribodipyrimidine photo-lyase
MITASFLVKDLHLDWRQGERFFAKYLTDYDPALNNGNWQWAASTGCDAQPYFRIFNPWLQQKKFDPEAIYIKRWIPELEPFDAKMIHRHESSPLATNYPAPMLDHREASTVAKSLFSS